MKKRFIALILCTCVLSGCTLNVDKKDSDKQVETTSYKDNIESSTVDISEYIDTISNSNCSLVWDYSGSVVVDKVTLRESSSGNLSVSYSDNLRFVNGYVNHEVYQNSGVDTLDYYVDSNNTFYVKDDSEELLLTYNDVDLISDIKSMLSSCNLVEGKDSFSGTYNLYGMSNDLYKYLFGEKFICNKDLDINVKVSISDNRIKSVKFSQRNYSSDITSINELDITYSFEDSNDLIVSSDYHQVGLPTVKDEFKYPDGYTYVKGYAYPNDSLIHYTNGNEEGYGYGDYILDGSCLVDTSQVKSYSIFLADEDNVNSLGSTIYTYTNTNNTYNYNPIYVQVFSYGHSELSDDLMNLYNSYCGSNLKIKPKDGEETRYFTVTYTIPIDSSKIYYEPSFTWYTGVDEHDAIYCSDVTGATSTSTFRFGSGCQITKYYVYCIDKNVTGEWFSTSLREGLNSNSVGNVYWR